MNTENDMNTANDTIREDIRSLKQEKANKEWVKAIVKPISKDVDKIKENTHHDCIKGDVLDNMQQALSGVSNLREEIGSWKFFRNLMIGAFGTCLLLAISAVIAFSAVKTETEQSKEKIDKIREELTELEHEKNTVLFDINSALISIKTEIEKRNE